MTVEITGATAVVTGASRGFGRAIATALNRHGAAVVGVARDAAALADVEADLGSSFTAIVSDVVADGLARQVLDRHQPNVVVLNAGATPHAASLSDQTWESFSENWNVDVRHVFEFVHAALDMPLAPGSTVISLSSGAALRGSPMSGGYAGAKAAIRFISDYARLESEQRGLGIRFVALLPKLTPVTTLGSIFSRVYADTSADDQPTEPNLTVEQVADAVVELAGRDASPAAAYLVTAAGLQEIG